MRSAARLVINLKTAKRLSEQDSYRNITCHQQCDIAAICLWRCGPNVCHNSKMQRSWHQGARNNSNNVLFIIYYFFIHYFVCLNCASYIIPIPLLRSSEMLAESTRRDAVVWRWSNQPTQPDVLALIAALIPFSWLENGDRVECVFPSVLSSRHTRTHPTYTNAVVADARGSLSSARAHVLITASRLERGLHFVWCPPRKHARVVDSAHCPPAIRNRNLGHEDVVPFRSVCHI